MDDRKKQIGEMEQRKREEIVSLDALLTRFGEALFDRAGDSFQEDDAAFEELAAFRRLKSDIANSETAIQAVEEQIRRVRKLEESIEAKKQEDSAGSKELAVMYGKLGKQLMDTLESADGDYADFCAPYRDQADALRTKAFSLEERLAGLGEKNDGNVFTWIGKNAQGLVLRSFLTKAQENLEQLHRNVGERYSRRDFSKLPGDETKNNSVSAAVEALCAGIEQKRAEVRTLTQELTELKKERQEISDGFYADGGPLKQIQILKNNIAHTQDELKILYRRLGAEAASIDGAGRRHIIDSFITSEDQETLDSAVRISRLIHEDEAAIEKLQASLAIDDEKAKIEKYRRMIQDKKDKIVQAEKSIMELEENIRVAGASIEKMQSLL